jgi:hypothetical protein
MNNIFRKILNEGLYKNEDFDKHDYLYLKKVLNDFINNDFIYTRNEDDEVVELYIKDLKNKKGDNFQDGIKRFKDWLNSNPPKLSDKVIRKEFFKDFEDYFGIGFTKIEKKDPTIISTSEQESIQAIFLAAKILGNDCFKDINILYKNEKKLNDKEISAREDIENLFYKNKLGITLANRRLVFSKEENKKVLKKLANILKINLPDEISKLKDRGFTIIHPDGLVNEYENAEFAKILFGKGVEFIRDEGQKRSLSKDSFIPADIYIIPLDTIDKLREIVVNAGKVFSPKSIVSLSNKLFKYEIGKDIVPLIYPISLKMTAGIPEFHKLDNSTVKTENLIQVGIDNIKKNGIYFNQTGNSTMEIEYGNDDTLVFEFRTKKTGSKWQCNAKNKNNRDAIEGGSAKEYMKMVFDDEMDGYINDDDVNKIVEAFGNRIRINGELDMSESFIKNKSAILEESFRKFFEDESTSKITTKDMVLLAVPGSVAHNNITSPSAKEGNIGLGLFCKKLIENGIEGSGNYNEKLSEIVQKSFKMNDFVQDTWKIM